MRLGSVLDEMAAEAREAAQEAALTDAAYCSIIYAIDNKRSADDG